METFLYILYNCVFYFLMVLEFCMLIRALLSWFITDEESGIVRFFFYVTEPVIFPVRALLERSEKIRNLPIDISFLVTLLLLSLIESLLTALI